MPVPVKQKKVKGTLKERGAIYAFSKDGKKYPVKLENKDLIAVCETPHVRVEVDRKKFAYGWELTNRELMYLAQIIAEVSERGDAITLDELIEEDQQRGYNIIETFVNRHKKKILDIFQSTVARNLIDATFIVYNSGDQKEKRVRGFIRSGRSEYTPSASFLSSPSTPAIAGETDEDGDVEVVDDSRMQQIRIANVFEEVQSEMQRSLNRLEELTSLLADSGRSDVNMNRLVSLGRQFIERAEKFTAKT